MYEKIILFLRGYLIIEIRGNALERFVDQIINSDIALKNLTRIQKDYYTVEIKIDDFKKLRFLLRNRMCSVSIIEKRGLPFAVNNLLKNKSLFMGFLLLIFMIWVFSQLIWLVEIDGLNEVSPYKVYNILEENGIEKGELKRSVDINLIERKLLNKISDFKWVNIYWSGTKLMVEVIEKKDISSTRPTDISATKSGIITEIIVLQGRALVEPGDIVTRGQSLIIGSKVDGKILPARGIVRGEVWYKKLGTAMPNEKLSFYTEKQQTKYGIKINNRLLFFPHKKNNFAYYIRKIEIKRLLKWRNNGLTIEFIKETDNELIEKKTIKSLDWARFAAKEEAIEAILKELETGDIISDIKIDKSVYDSLENRVRVVVLCKIKESIID